MQADATPNNLTSTNMSTAVAIARVHGAQVAFFLMEGEVADKAARDQPGGAPQLFEAKSCAHASLA